MSRCGEDRYDEVEVGTELPAQTFPVTRATPGAVRRRLRRLQPDPLEREVRQGGRAARRHRARHVHHGRRRSAWSPTGSATRARSSSTACASPGRSSCPNDDEGARDRGHRQGRRQAGRPQGAGRSAGDDRGPEGAGHVPRGGPTGLIRAVGRTRCAGPPGHRGDAGGPRTWQSSFRVHGPAVQGGCCRAGQRIAGVTISTVRARRQAAVRALTPSSHRPVHARRTAPRTPRRTLSPKVRPVCTRRSNVILRLGSDGPVRSDRRRSTLLSVTIAGATGQRYGYRAFVPRPR